MREITDAEKIRRLPWGIANSALNSFFYTATFGSSVFVLMLSEFHFPKPLIGLLLSLFPFCGMLALFIAPIVARWGIKRTFITCFTLRNFVLAALLVTPWLTLHGSTRVFFIFVSAVILVFALCRAVGETGYYPWYHEFVPNVVRGKYAAVSSLAATLAGILAMTMASAALKRDPGVPTYMWLIAVGAGVGFVGALLMLPLPGGAPRREAVNGSMHWEAMRAALHNSNFRRWLIGMGLMSCMVNSVTFVPLFMKESVGLSSSMVTRLDIAAMVGTLLASYAWGWAADRFGGRRVLLIAVGLMALLPIGWLAMPRHAGWSAPAALALAFAWGVANSGNGIGMMQVFFNDLVPVAARTSYTAIWYAWAGLTGGLSPLVAGKVLQLSGGLHGTAAGLRLDAFTPLFLLLLALPLAALFVYRTLRFTSAPLPHPAPVPEE